MELYAWIGEDEFGSGQVGIKIGLVPAGRIPLAAMDYDRHKLERVAPEMLQQAGHFNVTIRLARFVFAGDALVLRPKGDGTASLVVMSECADCAAAAPTTKAARTSEAALEVVAATKEVRNALSPAAREAIPELIRARLDLALAEYQRVSNEEPEW